MNRNNLIFTFPRLLEKVIAASSGRTAFRCMDTPITCGGPNPETDRSAFHIKHEDIRKVGRAGRYIDRALKTAVTLYTILKFGSAYLLLDSFKRILEMFLVMANRVQQVVLTTNSLLRKIDLSINAPNSLRMVRVDVQKPPTIPFFSNLICAYFPKIVTLLTFLNNLWYLFLGAFITYSVYNVLYIEKNHIQLR